MYNVTAYHPFAETGFDELFRGFFRPVRVARTAASIKMDVSEPTTPTSSRPKSPVWPRTTSRCRSKATR